MLLATKALAHVPVKVSPHRTLNSCKGVVRSRELASCDVSEIIDELKPQGVTEAVIISVRDANDNTKRRKTNTVILIFNRSQPPAYITAGYMRIRVDRYIQNPLRCYNCQRFGHGKAHCRREQACAKCGQVGHDTTDCQQREHCINCNGSHTAASKTCPKWILEKRVQQIRAEKNIPFKQAREFAVAEQAPSGPTMATVASAPRATVTGLPARPPVRAVDAHCQTEFTWPESENFQSWSKLQKAQHKHQHQHLLKPFNMLNRTIVIRRVGLVSTLRKETPQSILEAARAASEFNDPPHIRLIKRQQRPQIALLLCRLLRWREWRPQTLP